MSLKLESFEKSHLQSYPQSHLKKSRNALNDHMNIEGSPGDASEHNDFTDYEKMIQKLEGDIRTHIRIEQQLKLHIESIQNKLEEKEKAKPIPKASSEELDLIKREKRRMDELITFKEN